VLGACPCVASARVEGQAQRGNVKKPRALLLRGLTAETVWARLRDGMKTTLCFVVCQALHEPHTLQPLGKLVPCLLPDH